MAAKTYQDEYDNGKRPLDYDFYSELWKFWARNGMSAADIETFNEKIDSFLKSGDVSPAQVQRDIDEINSLKKKHSSPQQETPYAVMDDIVQAITTDPLVAYGESSQ